MKFSIRVTFVLPLSRIHRLYSRPASGGTPRGDLFAAARHSSYYSHKYAQIRGLEDVEPIAASEVFGRFREFENRHASKPRRALLASPWTPAPRVAALAAWFPVDAPLVLPKFHPTELTAVAPEALAAPVETLRALATLALQTGYSLPALRFGAIALTGVGRAVPTDSDRDLLWRAFQVPLYTQFRGFHGELLASECELHDGLHIDPVAAEFEETPGGLLVTSIANLRYPILRLISGFQARIETEPCPCGLETPRLLGLAPAGAVAVAKQRFAAA